MPFIFFSFVLNYSQVLASQLWLYSVRLKLLSTQDVHPNKIYLVEVCIFGVNHYKAAEHLHTLPSWIHVCLSRLNIWFLFKTQPCCLFKSAFPDKIEQYAKNKEDWSNIFIKNHVLCLFQWAVLESRYEITLCTTKFYINSV